MKKTLLALLLLWGMVIMPTAINAAEEECYCPCTCEDIDYSQDIIINEVLPNPSATEADYEWIELKNESSEDLDLSGWILGDSSTKTYTISEEDFSSTIIEAEGYFVIYREVSGISLNNSGDEVNLYQPDENLLDTIEYTESAKEDYSYAKDGDDWFWTSQPTPQAANEIIEDEEEAEEDSEESEFSDETEEEINYDYSNDLIISELLPDPEGSDSTDEFIEIYNAGSETIDLIGWSLADNSKTYTFSESTKIKSEKYKAFYVTDTKISLNNSGETISLIDPDGTIIFEVSYESSETGYSYVEDDSGNWVWTSSITPESSNEIIESEETESTEEDDESSAEEISDEYQTMSIKESRDQEKNTKVKVEGVVTVEPDVLGSQYFYIQDAESGIQIYSSKKYFPEELKTGNLISVTGKISESSNEKKINISTEEDIEIIGADQEVNILEVEEIGEDYEGLLVSTSSQILELESNKITLVNGILVYIKSGVEFSKSDYEEGEIIKVTGIVGQYKEDYRLMPRSSDDLENSGDSTASMKNSNGLIKKAYAAETSDQENFLENNISNKKILKYLVSVIIILFVLIIAVIYKTGIYKEWQKKIIRLWNDGKKSTKEKDAQSQYRE